MRLQTKVHTPEAQTGLFQHGFDENTCAVHQTFKGDRLSPLKEAKVVVECVRAKLVSEHGAQDALEGPLRHP